MVGPVPAKVRKTAVGKEQGTYFTVIPKNTFIRCRIQRL